MGATRVFRAAPAVKVTWRAARSLAVASCVLLAAGCGEERRRSGPEAAPPGAIGQGAAILASTPASARSTGAFRSTSTSFAWIAPGAFARAAGASPDAIAGDVVRAFAAERGIERGAADAAEVVAVHDAGTGPLVIDVRQTVDGLEVFGRELSILVRRDGVPVAVSGSLAAHIPSGPRRFALDERAAVAAAFERLTGAPLSAATLTASAAAGGYTRLSSPALRSARAKPVLYPGTKRLVPAYRVELEARGKAFAYAVSAEDASILAEADLIASESFSYRVWADPGTGLPQSGPEGSASTPHVSGQPDGTQYPAVAPSLVTLEAGPISTGDPWLPPGATTTSGNNVDAYADLAAPDGFSAGDLRASTTSPGTFDHAYDTADEPDASATQRMAAVTQAFYVTNYLHDWFYDLGFDEAAGNAQLDNYGRGGIAGDPMHVEVQDYSGTDNANMLTPGDGSPPRMQMYTFTSRGATIDVDTAGGTLSFSALSAAFGAQRFSTGPADLVWSPDAGTTASDACDSLAPASLDGRVALAVYSGDCDFDTAAQNAQNAGAVALVFVVGIEGEPFALFLPGDAPGVTIPVVGATGEAAEELQSGAGSVQVSLERAPGARSGALDTAIVAHEWGHYISNRLIGDGFGLTTNQARSLGEGWGDFHALLLMVRAEDALVPGNDQFQGVYPAGSYTLGGGLSTAYYFGIRRVPYSTDPAKNPLSFRHIEEDVPLPAGVPYAFDPDGASNAESHSSGEVWASMLWECYAGLLRETDRLTFDEARTRMAGYLVAAYKLTPNYPTFLEARDALLAVALANDPRDFTVCAQAFARRGAGIDAVAPPRNSIDHAGVVESFEDGPVMVLSGVGVDDDVVSCDEDGILDPGETATVTVQITNVGWSDLSGATATVTTTAPGVTIAGGGVTALSAAAPYENAYGTVEVSLAEGASADALWLDVSLQAPDAAATAGQVLLFVDRDEIPNASAADDFQALTHVPWTTAGEGGEPWRRVIDDQANIHWLGADHPAIGDQSFVSPPIQVSSDEPFSLAFSHRHEFEVSSGIAWDGGVVELSTDGSTWTDVADIVDPGYTAVLSTQAGNPLGGRSAFTGTSAGYPSFQRVELDLGMALAGQTIQLRFRIGTDVAVGATGWEIDDVEVAGVDAMPFVQIAAENGDCSDAPDAGTPDAATGGMADAAVPDAATPDAALPDAATPDAALPDAATPEPDAATPEPDAATPEPDAGPGSDPDSGPSAEPDAGPGSDPDTGDDSGGCGCSTSSGSPGGAPLLVGLALLCPWLTSRRRRPRGRFT